MSHCCSEVRIARNGVRNQHHRSRPWTSVCRGPVSWTPFTWAALLLHQVKGGVRCCQSPPPRSSHTIAVVEEMPPVSSPQPNSEPEAMLLSDPVCHDNAPTEGSEMPPVSSPH